MSLLKTCIGVALLALAGSPVLGQTFELLYSFPADGSVGRSPVASLTVGPTGPNGEQRLYGTAIEGGAYDGGTAFSVSLSGQVTHLADFNPENFGYSPDARLLNIGDGYLYGATKESIRDAIEWAGTIYRLHPDEGLSQVFRLPSHDPEQPTPTPGNPRALAYGEANTLHVLCIDYPGLWRVPLNGTPPEVVYSFGEYEVDGYTGQSLIRGTDGYLYGTTLGSADAGDFPNGRGTIFRIAPDGTGMTVLHECQWVSGTRPHGALLEGPDGNFYGVMRVGGQAGGGCVYRLTPSGEYTVLHHFGVQNNDLKEPYGDLMLGTDGQLYGTARDFGPQGYGGVFRIKMDGSGYKVLHSFNIANGAYPEGGLVQAADGYLYGTTTEGGTGNNGTVFRIKLKLPTQAENRPPKAANDVGMSTGNAVLIDVRSNDYDPDGDPLTVAIQSAPEKGTAVVQPGGLILYTPGVAYAGSDSFTYKVTDGRGGAAIATVRITSIEPEPLLLSRSYQGLLMHDPDLSGSMNEPRGQISVKLGVNGRFTGVLLTQRKRVTLRGTFSDKGNAVVHLKLPNKRKATLFLSIEAGTPNIMAAALFGPELWSGGALPTKGTGSSGQEQYTVGIATDPETVDSIGLPEGAGYGVMKVSPSGAVKVAGKLGDGSKLSWSSNLVFAPDGTTELLPVFSEPLAGGFIGGWLKAEEGEVEGVFIQGFIGGVEWKRPAPKKVSKRPKPYTVGFAGEIGVVATRYFPPVFSSPVIDITDGTVELASSKLSETLEGLFTLEGKKVLTSGDLRSLSFNRKTGLFSGKMRNGTKTLKFQGVVLQSLKGGVGQFSIGGETGVVQLGDGTTFE